MTDQTEPTVQVPVWLIERAADLIEEQYPGRGPLSTVGQLRALLSQPTPTTEPKGVSTKRLRDMADLLDGLLNRATLRQAADELDRLRASAPGTTFTARHHAPAEHRYRWNGSRVVTTASGSTVPTFLIDPSTIRDVTPPAVAP